VTEIRLRNADRSRQRGEQLLAARGISLPAIGLSPGAAYGTAKRWLPERFAESAAVVAAQTGAEIWSSVRKPNANFAPSCREVRGHNLAGATTLREFIDMTAACQVFLSNDSGAMHIAAALGIPSVTIFGPPMKPPQDPPGRMPACCGSLWNARPA